MSRSRFMAALRWIAAIIIGSLILQLKMDYLESYLFDLRVRLSPAPTPSNLVKIINVDKNSVEIFKQIPEAPHYVETLKNLLAVNPRAIVFLANPAHLKGSKSSLDELADILENNQNIFYVTADLELKGEEGKLKLPPPFQGMHVLSGPITTDSTVLAKDGVTRRLMLDYEGSLMLHPYLASQVNSNLAIPNNIQGVFDFYGTNQVYIKMLPKGKIETASFIDIYKNKNLNSFKDKFVFIGVDLEQSTKDYIMTSHSRELTAMTKSEAHANLLDALIRNDGLVPSPNWLNYLLTILISIITITVVMTLKPSRGLIILGSILFVYTFSAYFSFWLFDFWLDFTHPFLAIFICYYFFIPYRLIIENRTSWEYQQKNRLLTQVEELKSNFISMMSHDLKTPLARIQGMAEVLERHHTQHSAEEKTALRTIQSSSEELVHFVNTILEYSRLESHGIKLRLVSKDINTLIEDVCRKLEHLAQSKGITLRSELEPLFPIKMDPDLIKQVIHNLVENAIKYSPEGSKVLITSEERAGRVLIQVADQGAGIPESELTSIFMKFYRSANAKSSTVAGSGLGLYLAKYFTDMHKGQLSVESKVGLGSTFFLELGDDL